MSPDNLEVRIKQVMADTFKTDIDNINDDASPDTIENWDSLQQLNLVSALEAEFDMMLEPDDVVDMISYSLIVSIVKERLST